ncbi:MAG: hypothetical protein Q4F38_09435 [Akkermansia sp.]|nr:hypothetical protein [Akkermansia sp.]
MVLISVNRFKRAGSPRISRAHFTAPALFWQAKSDELADFCLFLTAAFDMALACVSLF